MHRWSPPVELSSRHRGPKTAVALPTLGFGKPSVEQGSDFVRLVGVVCVGDSPLGVDQPILGKSRGWEGHILQPLSVDLAGVVVQDGKLDAKLIAEPLEIIATVHGGDAPDPQSAIFVLGPEVLADVRDLGRTDRSPSGKVNQKDGVAQLFAETDPCSIEGGQLEVRCGRAKGDAEALI